MAISDIVSVSISVQDSAPNAVAFDTPVIMAKAPFVGSRLYTATPAGLSAMTTDGFATYDRAYRLGSRIAGQTGGAGSFFVYSRPNAADNVTHTMRLTVDITKTQVGETLTFNYAYQGVSATITHTITTNTVDAILDAFEALMVASAVETAGAATVPDGATATYLETTADVAGDFVQFDLGDEGALELTDVTTDSSTTLATQLAAMKADLGASAFGLLIDTFDEVSINAAAAFALSNNMIGLFNCPNADILDSGSTTDIASDLQAASNHNAAACFSRNMSSDWAAGLLGLQLGKTAGSATWAFQTIAGATADVLSATDLSVARGKNAVTYVRTRGVSHTFDGFAGSGRFLDITHGVALLQANLENSVYQLFLNQEKVPFNQVGLGQVEAAIRGPLSDAEADELIEPGWDVTMPSLEGYSSVDKANRLLRTVTFDAVLTGAVHSVTIVGTLTLD